MSGYDGLYVEYMKTAKAPVQLSNTTLAVFAVVATVLVLLL